MGHLKPSEPAGVGSGSTTIEGTHGLLPFQKGLRVRQPNRGVGNAEASHQP